MVGGTLAIPLYVCITTRCLRLKDDNKVGDGGGDHGSDGGSGDGEVALPRECLRALHTSDGVLQDEHVSEKNKQYGDIFARILLSKLLGKAYCM
jgi:hypothetical protein